MIKRSLILLTCIISLMACKQSRFKIDTDVNRVNVHIKRFDQSMLSMDTTNTAKAVDQLSKQYPEFMNVFCNQVLNTDPRDKAAIAAQFRQYLSDKTFAKANQKTKELYSNVDDIELQISDAFTYIHHYFPEVKLPEVYFFVSGFNRAVMMNQHFVGIGTDYYLGSDFPLYKTLTYNYMLNNMKKENLAPDLVSVVLFRMFVMNGSENRLLDNMLFRGKIFYLMSVFMPDEKPENIIGYSQEQWQWSKKYEKDIWTAIMDKKDLFSTDVMLINKYMNDAPFTAPISQQSPGRLGAFIGWQIISSYMEKNSELSLKQLVDEQDYQKILEQSGYHP